MPVNTPAEEYEENEADWRMIRDVLAGAKAVREGGDKYLPRLSDMSYGEYAAYAKRAQFFNATARTLSGLVGAIFRKEPEIYLGEAESLRPRLESCTIDNQPFTVFARSVTRETMAMGRVGGMVDAPADGGTPYFTHYAAEHITNWRLTQFNDNRIVPDQIVLKEERIQPNSDGFGASKATIYRELFLDGNGVYTQRVWVPVRNRDNTESYAVESVSTPRISGLGNFNYEIPFVCFGPNKVGLPIQRSPILDIAELNILHFQRSAQLAHGQFYTATPTYWAVPPNASGELPEYRVGPSMVWLVDQPNSCGILEYRGEGLKYLESACAQLEQQMMSLGARLTASQSKAAAENIEVANLRHQSEGAQLVETIESIENGLTALLKIWVRWQGRNPKDVKVTFNRNFTGIKLEYRTWLQFDRAHERGDIDDDTYYRILFESDTLPASYSHKDVEALIDKARQNRAEKAAEKAANEAVLE